MGQIIDLSNDDKHDGPISYLYYHTNTQFIDFKDISTKCLLSTNHKKERKERNTITDTTVIQSAKCRLKQETLRGLHIINYVRKKRWRRNLQTKRDLIDISNSYNVWTLFGS